MCIISNDIFFFFHFCIYFFFFFGITVRACLEHATVLKISPSHPELPPAELFSYKFAYKLLRVFCFLVFFQFYIRIITLTTVRVTIRPDLPRLATAPFVRPPLRNTKRKFVNKLYSMIIQLHKNVNYVTN